MKDKNRRGAGSANLASFSTFVVVAQALTARVSVRNSWEPMGMPHRTSPALVQLRTVPLARLGFLGRGAWLGRRITLLSATSSALAEAARERNFAVYSALRSYHCSQASGSEDGGAWYNTCKIVCCNDGVRFRESTHQGIVDVELSAQVEGKGGKTTPLTDTLVREEDQHGMRVVRIDKRKNDRASNRVEFLIC